MSASALSRQVPQFSATGKVACTSSKDSAPALTLALMSWSVTAWHKQMYITVALKKFALVEADSK